VTARPVQRSAAGPLAAAYAAVVLYASLYPFTGWRWPPGPPLAALLALPWPPWRDSFDVIANMLGYMPLGALLYVAQVRGGRSRWLSLAWAVLPCAGLSWMLEVTQQFLPGRAPSRVDWALNCAGAATGALLSALLHGLGLLQRWQTVRERWFVLPELIALSAIPLTTVALLLSIRALLGQPIVHRQLAWLPFALSIGVFVFGFLGLAYSIYPFVVIDRLTIWQAASSPAALKVVLVGVCISVPAIAAYTVFSYRVFRGKATALRYG
jgi:cytochrome bd-type quinol oxidase subunit 2